MVEIIILMVVFGAVGLGGLVVGGMYRADPKGWQTTFQRLSRTVRANVEAGKPAKALGAVNDTSADDWDAQFSGKPKAVEASKPKVFEHKIVEKWYAVYGGSESPFWKCSCGHQDWHVDKFMANGDAREHVRNGNAAEKAKASGSKLQW